MVEKKFTLEVTEDEFQRLSKAITYRIGTLIVSASSNKDDKALMGLLIDLGASLDDQVSEQE